MTALMELQSVTVRYGRALAVDDVSLTVESGEVLAIFGRNGAGKSSLLQAIAGMQARSGRVLVAGTEVPQLDSPRVVREGLAIVLERRGLFSNMSVEQNLEVAYYGKGIRSRAAIRKAGGFAAAYDRFPLLYEKRRSPAGSLSGGQQQMLAIGRALVCAPRLLMLDEPSLGLAPIVIGAVYEAIRDLRASGISMLLIEENPQRALDVADRVMVMDRGQVRFEASSQLARESPERFRAAYFGRDVSADPGPAGARL